VIKPSREDWAKIYHAVEGMRTALCYGEQGPDNVPADIPSWIDSLGSILLKIGPDGENMTGEVTGEEPCSQEYTKEVHLGKPMGIDWTLLREQKLAIFRAIDGKPQEDGDVDLLEGIVSLIDSIQDDAVDRDGLNEETVFGKPEEEEETT